MLPLRSLVVLSSAVFCVYPPDKIKSACAFDIRNIVLLIGTFFSPRVSGETHLNLFYYTGYLSWLHSRAYYNPGNDVWLMLSVIHNAAHSLALLTAFGSPWSQIDGWDVLWGVAAGICYIVAFATPLMTLRGVAAVAHALCFLRAARTVPIWFQRTA